MCVSTPDSVHSPLLPFLLHFDVQRMCVKVWKVLNLSSDFCLVLGNQLN